jgi:hydrogenase-4 component F
MQPIILFILLLVSAGLAYLPIKSEKILRQVSLGGAVLFTGLAFWLAIPALTSQPQFWSQDLWSLDRFSAFMVLLVGGLYLSASFVSYRYLAQEFKEGILQLKQVRLYLLSLPLFILSMFVVIFANNMGVLWVALEATTLTTTFLVAFYTKDASLEAAWKYIIICSTGIALGLLGILMFAYAGTSAGSLSAEDVFHLNQLRLHADTLLPEIVKWAFVFVFIGIGTKVGFVPMHAWLPDAHSKTPSPISAILSGVLLNVALYTILRFKLITDLSLENTWWTERFFLTFGLLSIVIPAFLI